MNDMTTIEQEKGQQKLATIDQAVNTLLRLGRFKTEKEAFDGIKQYREDDRKLAISFSPNDVWAAFLS